jgi:hypothetical protein
MPEPMTTTSVVWGWRRGSVAVVVARGVVERRRGRQLRGVFRGRGAAAAAAAEAVVVVARRLEQCGRLLLLDFIASAVRLRNLLIGWRSVAL